ncbi:RabGAP/TBC [Auriscalpium vulgare]|uniref:RabGAP/TBC n=1 Tax=Auriscalpium vulgare TaxID=40419 RepID=A0ACB8R2K4_9AGAM|nr:RabGAP/TBC [Auriscalpium vulgare]
MARASRSSLRRRTSVDTDVSNHSDARSVTSPIPASSSGVVRNTSLRSKLSLSALRAKSSTQNFRDEKPTFEDAAQRDNETVQVEDLDFELVRPSIPAARASEDSSIYGRSSINGDAKADRPTFLRAESPASSTSGFPLRSPASGSEKGIPQPRGATVEAHRARELKWISAMASTPSSQARKSKKIRKLLQDGVPASVRYQVWAHLTDSKAKRIDGLYGQLSKREKVPAFADIERDVRQCFPTDARMSEPGGPIVSLLHAYLSMVPDIQYHKGLAYIAGQLLLQSPEEDAFWIFISLMDTHLRPYFSPNAIQMDVDASLFAKALEVADASVAKKLFVDMSIQPVRVIRPWFSSLFVEALPTEYFQRVWDIFLSEGIVYLIRVGLAILTLCRRVVLDGKGEGQVLNILARPPAILMSSSPDNLIELANSFKVKDDDIRKQRVKMEAQLKRQTQSRLAATAPGQRASAQPPSISLPRA